MLSDRRNIVVIADEAHRSQYDFIDGFARQMHDALPHASFIGLHRTDFLPGLSAASSLAFGNADKYFRQRVMNAYLTDDFRILSTVTINEGVRWEYESPITEKYGRLVNLDIAPDFTSATPVIAGDKRNSLARASEPDPASRRIGVAAVDE